MNIGWSSLMPYLPACCRTSPTIVVLSLCLRSCRLCAIYLITPDQLTLHEQEAAKLGNNEWIGSPYSPACAPTMMVDTRGDGSEERKMRIVVDFSALLRYPLTSHCLLFKLYKRCWGGVEGAKCFSTLDLEAGFQQARMAKRVRWTTALDLEGGFHRTRMVKGVRIRTQQL